MKQPVVDYRKFRFSKLNDPEFSHLKLLAGWLVYFLFYFLTENFIPYDAWPWLVRCASLLSAEKRRCDISSFVYTSY